MKNKSKYHIIYVDKKQYFLRKNNFYSKHTETTSLEVLVALKVASKK